MKQKHLIALVVLLLPIAASSNINIKSNKTEKKTKVVKQKKGKKMFNQNIVQLALDNTNFRKELVTGPHSQVVVMNIPVGQDIGMETHKVDQTLVFVQGQAKAILNGKESLVYENHLVFVPAGTQHNFINVGQEELKLYTIYAPAQHKPGTVEKTKAEYE